MTASNLKFGLKYYTLLMIIFVIFLLTGCASVPLHNQALERARSAYETAKLTPNIEATAPVALYDAKNALEKAEQATHDSSELEHLAYLAEKKAQIAVLISAEKTSEMEIAQLGKKKNQIVLQARENESNAAKAETEKKSLEAELARKKTQAMMVDMEKKAIAQAEKDLILSEEVKAQAQKDRILTEEAQAQAIKALAEKKQLEEELSALQAKQTNRGAVITLGNILFEVNQSTLLPGGLLAIDKLSAFLNKYPSRKLLIEGHTDSRGSDIYNLGLSQQRANSVFTTLTQAGIDQQRIMMKGYGEQYPITENETAAGRQQNRRVEVVILEEGVNPKQKLR